MRRQFRRPDPRGLVAGSLLLLLVASSVAGGVVSQSSVARAGGSELPRTEHRIDGLSTTFEASIANQPPDASFTASDTEVSVGTTVDFDASGSSDSDGDIIKYAWDFDGDGTFEERKSCGCTASYTYEQAGEYDATLLVEDDDGATDTTSVTITVGDTNDAPNADVDAEDTTAKAGETVEFDATGSTDSDGYIENYAWDFDGDGTFEYSDPSFDTLGYEFSEAGDHIVTVKVTDDDGATDTASVVVSVAEANDPPSADIAMAAPSSGPPIVGESATLTASGSTDDGSIAKYAWDVDGDGDTEATGESIEHRFTTAGSKTVTLTVTDDGGKTDTTTQTVSVRSLVEITPASPAEGEQITFSTNDAIGTKRALALVNPIWDIEGISSKALGKATTQTFSSPGTYTVEYTVGVAVTCADCAKHGQAFQISQERTVVVGDRNRAPTARFSVPTTNPSPGDTVRFDAQRSGDLDGEIQSYKWDFDGDGHTDAFGKHEDHAYDDPGTYTVILTVTDAGGKTDTRRKQVVVDRNEAPSVTFRVTPNGAPPGTSVAFDAAKTSDPDGRVASYEWDFDGDGDVDARGERVHNSFPEPGTYSVALTATDENGRSNSKTKTVTVTGSEKPVIVGQTFDIKPFPVEQDESATVSVEVRNVDPARAGNSVSLELTAGNSLTSGTDSYSFEMERRAGTVFEVKVPRRIHSRPPGSKIELKVVATNGAGTATLENTSTAYPRTELRVAPQYQYPSNPDNKRRLHYYVFREVTEVPVVIATFKNQNLANTDFDTSTAQGRQNLRQWQRAREFDINSYYGSARGSMGAIGFDFRYLDNGTRFYTVGPRSALGPAGYNEGLTDLVNNEIEFTNDVQQAAGVNQFFIATHPGDPPKNLPSRGDAAHITGPPALGVNVPRIYASMTEDHYGIWAHELGHSRGLIDLYKNDELKGGIGGLALMGTTSGAYASRSALPQPIAPMSRTGLADENGAWLQTDPFTLDTGQSRTIRLDSITGFTLRSDVPVFNTQRESNNGTVKYVFQALSQREGRPQSEGKVLIYKVAQQGTDPITKATLVHKPGSPFVTLFNPEQTGTVTDLITQESGLWASFSMTKERGKHEEYRAFVKTTVTAGPPNQQTVTLDDTVTVANGGGSSPLASRENVTTHDLDLRAIDSNGNVTGVLDNGTFVNQIPGSHTSGERQGLEWISVPRDANVTFEVVTRDVTRLIETTNLTRENVSISYETSVIETGENPQLRTRNGSIQVTNTTVKVVQQSGQAGGTLPAFPSPGSLDIASVDPTGSRTAESITIENTASKALNLSGLTVTDDDGHSFAFPKGYVLDADATVTIHSKNGSATGTDRFWNASTAVWDDEGDTIRIEGRDGETTILAVRYDDQTAIHYSPSISQRSRLTGFGAVAEVNETVRAVVTITNDGLATNRTLRLRVNATVVDQRTVRIDGGETEQVAFETAFEKTGNYAVQVGSLRQFVRVPPARHTVQSLTAPAVAGVNETITVTASVENTGGEAGANPVSVIVAGKRKAVENVSLAPGENRTVTVEVDTAQLASGSRSISVLTPHGQATASVEIVAVTLPFQSAPATNTDSDQLLEDINGDHTADASDVFVYMNNRRGETIRNNPRVFDFDGDGQAGDLGDVIALFNEVTG